MSVRQYIGARYVTKIYENSLDPSSAEWEASINYEPLTLVTYNYGSYLSKKEVPASIGNPADNPTYWTQTGFYNGQIAQLNNDVSELQNQMAEVRTKKYIFCGDSYATNNVLWGDGWIDKVTSNMGLTPGVTEFDARDLVGYFGGSFAAGTFKDQLEAIYNAYTDDADTFTDICCFAGTNEVVYTNTQIDDGIKDFCDYAKAHFPNAKILIGFIGGCQNTSNWNDFTRAMRIYKNCGQHGAGYVSNIEFVNTEYRNYTPDELHPTDFTTIAEYITMGIITGSVSYGVHYQVTDNDGNTINIKLYNDIMTFNVVLKSPTAVVIPQGFDMDPNNSVLITDFGRLPILRYDAYLTPNVLYNKNSEGWMHSPIYLILQPDGKLYAQIPNYGNTSEGNLPIGTLLTSTPQILTCYPWNTSVNL